MTQGSNILTDVFKTIDPVQVQYLAFMSRELNMARQWVPMFALPVPAWGYVQAVKKTKYSEFGLDWQRNYVKIFVAMNIVDLDRDSAGDRFTWNGRLYQMVDDTNWFIQDGWASCMAVDIGIAP